MVVSSIWLLEFRAEENCWRAWVTAREAAIVTARGTAKVVGTARTATTGTTTHIYNVNEEPK